MKSKILFVVSLLFALVFINSGLNKFFNYMPMPKDMPQEVMQYFGYVSGIKWLLPLVAVAEILGGILIIFRKTRALGALMIFPVMIGILLTHIFNVPNGLPIALALSAVLIWIMYENRQKYFPLIRE